jgi:nucleoside-diphosphate-sugar epimerase
VKFTVLGASGFIGSHLKAKLLADGHEVLAPARGVLPGRDTSLGHVLFCIGLTADFRSRPFDTVRAHVSVLADVLEQCRFDSLLYLSSTRVYAKSAVAREDSSLCIDVCDPSDLYNASKIMGESLCLGSTNAAPVRVARLSNVYGADFGSQNFLTTLVSDAVDKGSVALRMSRDSAKDYVAVSDVAALLPRIALSGRHRLYNVASGESVTNGAILVALQASSGCSVAIDDGAPRVSFPPVNVSRIRAEFAFRPASVIEDLPQIIQRYREHRKC